MRRSHVEQRSAKYAPRQYVSETHDHKPDAPARLPASATLTDPHLGRQTVAPIDQEQP